MASARDLVREGMRVYSSDAVELGTVFKLDAEHFIITRGKWLPIDYLCNYAHVVDVTDSVHLDETLAEVKAGLAVEPDLQLETGGGYAEQRREARRNPLVEGFDSQALSTAAEESDRRAAEATGVLDEPEAEVEPAEPREAPESDEELARSRRT